VEVRAEDLILVSVDDHICEPPDMFDAHVPARYKDQAPRVVEEEGGVQQWWYGDIRGRNLGLNAVAGKPPEYYNIDPSRYEEMRPGCYDVHERVRDMNAGGQLAGLNFPNWTGFSGQVLNQGPDPDVNDIMIKAYNDWHVDEWCGAYPDRFIPCGLLPLFDVERAAAEIHRLAAKGCHAVTFSERPEALQMPSIHSDYWDPLFAAACDEGTILCAHVFSSSQIPTTSADAPPSASVAISPCASIFTLGELLWCDVFRRFPDLRFSLTEGDVGWIPYFVWRAEHVHARHHGWTLHEFPDGMGPEDVFRKHLLCCFISDPIGVELIDHFNIDNLCWESDYPHSDGSWPNSPEIVTKLLGRLGDAQINKITHENAIRHYRFDPFAIRARQDCTVGALRALSPDVDTVTRVGRPAGHEQLAAWNRMKEHTKRREAAARATAAAASN
jgi:predicted TIM-barrel fold metal-dependent hydrolase